ncbi:type II toxin-antitoxin system RelB/DinJ family antitoxin [Lactovum odontotermitis]
MENVQVSTRVSKEIKEAAQRVYERQGLDISVVIKMLLTKTAREGRIPLDITGRSYYEEIGDSINRLVDEKLPEAAPVNLENPESVRNFFDD